MTEPAVENRWRALPFEVADAHTLLARGAALLDELADRPAPALRWYRATTPALVLGRGQSGLAGGGASDGHPIAGALPIVTRFSGGGAVLMDEGLLSVDVLIPAGDPLLSGDLTAVFLRVGKTWAAALRDLGVADVTVHTGPGPTRRHADPRQRLLAEICYATLGRGEVAAAGRKLVGLSQRRRRAGALVQCGLLRRWNPTPILAALGEPADDPEMMTRAVGLDDLVHPPPSDEAVMAAFARQIEEHDD